MMVVTLQTHETLRPTLSVRGGIIKLDLGALLLEMDTETFKNMMADLITQAGEHQIYILAWGAPKAPQVIEGDPYRG